MKKVMALLLFAVLLSSISVAAYAETQFSEDGEWCIIDVKREDGSTVKVDSDGKYRICVSGEEGVLSKDGDLQVGGSTEKFNVANWEEGLLAYVYDSGWFEGYISGFAILNDSHGGLALYSFSGKPESVLFFDGKIVPAKNGTSIADGYYFSGNALYFIYGDYYEKASLSFFGDMAFCSESEASLKSGETYLSTQLFFRPELLK